MIVRCCSVLVWSLCLALISSLLQTCFLFSIYSLCSSFFICLLSLDLCSVEPISSCGLLKELFLITISLYRTPERNNDVVKLKYYIYYLIVIFIKAYSFTLMKLKTTVISD